MQLIVWKVGLLLMCIPIHTINCLKSWTINYMCTYSYNRLCEKLGYYSYGHVLVQLIVRRIRNMIVHMRVLFITCVLDCMNSCTSDCLYEHPWSDPSSQGPDVATTPSSLEAREGQVVVVEHLAATLTSPLHSGPAATYYCQGPGKPVVWQFV